MVMVHFSDGQPPGSWQDHAIQGHFSAPIHRFGCASGLSDDGAGRTGARSADSKRLGVECLESIAMSRRPFPDQEAASFIGKHSVAFLLPDQGAPGGVSLKASGSLVTFD